MTKKATLVDVSTGYASQTTLNNNFQALNDQFDNTLSLDGSTPNAMGADLDMNSNDILNANSVSTTSLTVAGSSFVPSDAVSVVVPEWQGAWTTATAYAVNDLVREAGSTYICLVAHTSGTFSTDLSASKWELFAQQGAAGVGSGDMLAANNLSDVASAATSRSNIGAFYNGGVLTSANDLNSLTVDGVYSWASSSRPSNTPDFNGLVIQHNNGATTDQLAVCNHVVYIRRYAAPSWTSWVELVQKSTDGTLAGNSDDEVPTEKAVKTYVDTEIAAIDVGADTASLGAEDIGSYGFFQFTGGTINPGGTTAGSNLKWASLTAGAEDVGSSPTGTWMALSYHNDTTDRLGLFKRVS